MQVRSGDANIFYEVLDDQFRWNACVGERLPKSLPQISESNRTRNRHLIQIAHVGQGTFEGPAKRIVEC